MMRMLGSFNFQDKHKMISRRNSQLHYIITWSPEIGLLAPTIDQICIGGKIKSWDGPNK